MLILQAEGAVAANQQAGRAVRPPESIRGCMTQAASLLTQVRLSAISGLCTLLLDTGIESGQSVMATPCRLDGPLGTHSIPGAMQTLFL